MLAPGTAVLVLAAGTVVLALGTVVLAAGTVVLAGGKTQCMLPHIYVLVLTG